MRKPGTLCKNTLQLQHTRPRTRLKLLGLQISYLEELFVAGLIISLTWNHSRKCSECTDMVIFWDFLTFIWFTCFLSLSLTPLLPLIPTYQYYYQSHWRSWSCANFLTLIHIHIYDICVYCIFYVYLSTSSLQVGLDSSRDELIIEFRDETIWWSLIKMQNQPKISENNEKVQTLKLTRGHSHDVHCPKNIWNSVWYVCKHYRK